MVAVINHRACLPFLSKQCRQRENTTASGGKSRVAQLIGFISSCSSRQPSADFSGLESAQSARERRLGPCFELHVHIWGGGGLGKGFRLESKETELEAA